MSADCFKGGASRRILRPGAEIHEIGESILLHGKTCLLLTGKGAKYDRRN
jgi:hypothetical protein